MQSKNNVFSELIDNKQLLNEQYKVISGNLPQKFNELANPSAINIYPKNYDNKEKIKEIISEYNKEQSNVNKIRYTNYIGILINEVTTIVDVISYVLIAFVAVNITNVNHLAFLKICHSPNYYKRCFNRNSRVYTIKNGKQEKSS